MAIFKVKVGDIVRLKCGGPLMIVVEENRISGSQILTCIWFDHAKDRCRSLPREALEKIVDPRLF
jgi:uncharacterized protein YodC (DUF2158 family)